MVVIVHAFIIINTKRRLINSAACDFTNVFYQNNDLLLSNEHLLVFNVCWLTYSVTSLQKNTGAKFNCDVLCFF